MYEKELKRKDLMLNNLKNLIICLLIFSVVFSFITCDNPTNNKSSSQTSLPVLSGTVSITGIAQVGDVLTANTSSLSGSGDITFQWKRGGDTLVGNNSRSYDIITADIGYSITVTVTRSGYSNSITSAPTGIVTKPDLPILDGGVSIDGTAQVGETLTANTSLLGGSGDIVYLWQRDEIVVGTESSYIVQADDAGYTITVTVSRANNSGNISSPETAIIRNETGTGDDSETVKIYYFGYTNNMPCYWQGTTRIDMPVPAGCTFGHTGYMVISDGIVYCTGWYTINGIVYPCYWQGATRIDLPIPVGNFSNLTKIIVDNGIVYISGYYYYPGDNNSTRPCYWQGATRIDLPIPGGSSGRAVGCIVVGGVVYSTGYYAENVANPLYEIDKPCYWQGTTRIDLPVPDSATGGGVTNNSITVDGGVIYIGGSYTEGNYGDTSRVVKPCYWVGTNRIDLPIPDSTSTVGGGSLFVESGIVYTASYYYNLNNTTLGYQPCYWQGTTRFDLSKPAGSLAPLTCGIKVVGGIVYTGGATMGYYNNTIYTPCYWQGTTRVDLPGIGTVQSINVVNGTIYCIGSTTSTTSDDVYISRYWKGTTEINLGTLTPISTGSATYSYADIK